MNNSFRIEVTELCVLEPASWFWKVSAVEEDIGRGEEDSVIEAIDAACAMLDFWLAQHPHFNPGGLRLLVDINGRDGPVVHVGRGKEVTQ